MRRLFSFVFVAGLVALAGAACDKGGGATAGADGGKPIKRACKMLGKCYLCPDDAALNKCIINPDTSGCKPASDADCEK